MQGAEPTIEEHGRKRRFSADTVNDLLFWGCHLMIVAISLAIMWTKMEGTAQGLRTLLVAQNQELDLARAQALKADGSAQAARNAEHQRAIQVEAAAHTIDAVLTQVSEIQNDIKATLATANATNQLVLNAIEVTRAASQKSEEAARQASSNAGAAASRASVAAAASGRAVTVVKTRVVTSEDKLALQQQQRRLVQKQQQLSKTINRVKKNGPTLWDKLVH